MKPRSKVWFHLRGQKDLALILSANTVLDPVSILGILFHLLKFSRILTKLWVSDVIWIFREVSFLSTDGFWLTIVDNAGYEWNWQKIEKYQTRKRQAKCAHKHSHSFQYTKDCKILRKIDYTFWSTNVDYYQFALWKLGLKHDQDFYGKSAFSVKSTFLHKKLLIKSWFHGNFWEWSCFIAHTVTVQCLTSSPANFTKEEFI